MLPRRRRTRPARQVAHVAARRMAQATFPAGGSPASGKACRPIGRGRAGQAAVQAARGTCGFTRQTAPVPWQTADGRRQTADGRRQTADGRRQTADGRRQTADGRRQTADGRRSMGLWIGGTQGATTRRQGARFSWRQRARLPAGRIQHPRPGDASVSGGRHVGPGQVARPGSEGTPPQPASDRRSTAPQTGSTRSQARPGRRNVAPDGPRQVAGGAGGRHEPGKRSGGGTASRWRGSPAVRPRPPSRGTRPSAAARPRRTSLSAARSAARPPHSPAVWQPGLLTARPSGSSAVWAGFARPFGSLRAMYTQLDDH